MNETLTEAEAAESMTDGKLVDEVAYFASCCGDLARNPGGKRGSELAYKSATTLLARVLRRDPTDEELTKVVNATEA